MATRISPAVPEYWIKADDERFQEAWNFQAKSHPDDSFVGLTRISRPGRPAAHFYSRPVWPWISGVVELSSGSNATASPALAGME